jgi:AbrB family looped-hinge helix DNA binding protein
MLNVRVNPKGQVTLPREIRRKLKIKTGDQMAVILDGGQIVFKPITHTLLDLRGRVRVSGKQDFDAIRQQAMKKRAQKRES